MKQLLKLKQIRCFLVLYWKIDFLSPSPSENDLTFHLNPLLLIFYQVTIDVTSPGAGIIQKVTISGLLLFNFFLCVL